MKKVKIVLTLLITMSLFWIAPSASKSVNAEDNQDCTRYSDWSVKGLNDISEYFDITGGPGAKVVLNFIDGQKKLNIKLPKEKDFRGCSNLKFKIPNDVKRLLVYENSVWIDWEDDLGRGPLLTAVSVKRGIMNIKSISYDDRTHIVSGSGLPGSTVQLSTILSTEKDNWWNLVPGREVQKRDVKIDATGKWAYKYTDDEKKRIDELTVIKGIPHYDEYKEEIVFSEEKMTLATAGKVYPIVAGNQYIEGERPEVYFGSNGDDVFRDNPEIRVTFPNGRIVKQSLISRNWRIKVPNDVVLKPQDKVKVQLFSNELFKKSSKPVVAVVGKNDSIPTPKPVGSLSGQVWIDSNKNGKYEKTEVLVPSVQVSLLNKNKGIIGTVKTDAKGYYKFSSLSEGDYSVTVQKPNGYQFTTQNAKGVAKDINSDVAITTGNIPKIHVAAGKNTPNNDAGLVKQETPKPTPKPTVNYSAHVQNIGWQAPVKDGALAGTSGRSLRVESFRMNLTNLPMSGGIKYATHVQDIGWQGAVKDNEISGTTGKSLRMEAMKISLTGEISKYYDVYYRTHIQDYGWLGWAKNGQNAGSEGNSLRMEAIEVKLVKKGDPAPQTGASYVLANGQKV